MIFLVRHAKAGHRSAEYPDDRQRPLSPNGWTQSEMLVSTLIAAGATGPLLSSPYVRCVQTLEPLARELRTDVVSDKRLAEGKPFLPALTLIQESPEGTVLSSHGDLIPDIITALERRGCPITTEPNWKKGAVWVLTRNDHREIVSAACWPPPDSPDSAGD